MESEKRARLEAKGWAFGDAADFLGMNDEERKLLELRGALSHAIRDRRKALGLTQAEAAKRIKTGQSRFAAIEAGMPRGASIDLMLKAFFSLEGHVEVRFPVVEPAAVTAAVAKRKSLPRRGRRSGPKSGAASR